MASETKMDPQSQAHEVAEERKEMYGVLMPTIRSVAHRRGYAIAIHGSMSRDLDLIAVPWVEEASTTSELIEAIRAAVGGTIFSRESSPTGRGSPSFKPHGRKAWSIYLTDNTHDGPYIDISVPNPIEVTDATSVARNAGWVVGSDKKPLRHWLTMGRGVSEWTSDINKALWFASREDAELFSAECEDAWIITRVREVSHV